MTMTISRTHVSAEPAIEYVDPDMAREWLGRNVNNRSLRKSTVAAYAWDMEHGHWRFTGDPVRFSTDGTLLDGQHRLHALILAGVTLQMLVVRNVEPEAQEVMDTGAKRSPADALALRGERSTTVLASVAAVIANQGRTWNRRVTTAEIIAVLEDDDSVRSIVTETLPSLNLGHILPPTVTAYAYWRLNKIDSAATWKFFDSLSSGVGLPEGSPLIALDRRLRKIEGLSKGSRAYRTTALACIFTAWNAWRRGESRQKIQLNYDTKGAIQIPEPK